MKRIWTAHAYSPLSFALSVGELDHEKPFSTVAVFDEGNSVNPWSFVQLPRTIVSITTMNRPNGSSVFVALSDEGDVYFMEGDIPVEKIPGAGIHSADATGLGATEYIRQIGDSLYVCGNGSQVYIRKQNNAWLKLLDRNQDNIPDNAFSVLEGLSDNSGIAVCGFTRTTYRTPTKDEQLEIQRAKESGSKKEYKLALRKFTGKQAAAQGCLYLLNNGSWQSISLPTNRYLHGLANLGNNSIVVVGSGGTLLLGADADSFEDRSVPGIVEKFKCTKAMGNDVLVLGEQNIYVFNKNLEMSKTIALPPGLQKPNTIEVTGDVIWYFDYLGVARYTNGNWQSIEVPKAIWGKI